MFGYVRPYKSEMLVREYEQYKGIYCELCRQLGKGYGWAARFTLSYDCTFYAVLALSVSGAKVKLRQGKCAANPLKKCNYLPSEGEEYQKAAALSLIMTYHKLRDDLADDGFFRSLGARLLLPFVSRKAKKAEARYPFLGTAVKNAMEDQRLAEEEQGGVDRCAEPTAKMLSEIFQELGGCQKSLCLPLERFGYFLGRWVYLMDAADDLAEDLSRGSFNPFIARLGLTGKTELTEEEQRTADEACNEALNATAAQMLPALNLIPLENFAPLVENVVQKGLPEIQREILFLHVTRKKRKKEKLFT